MMAGHIPLYLITAMHVVCLVWDGDRSRQPLVSGSAGAGCEWCRARLLPGVCGVGCTPLARVGARAHLLGPSVAVPLSSGSTSTRRVRPVSGDCSRSSITRTALLLLARRLQHLYRAAHDVTSAAAALAVLLFSHRRRLGTGERQALFVSLENAPARGNGVCRCRCSRLPRLLEGMRAGAGSAKGRTGGG